MDLQIRRCLIQAQDNNDSTALRKAYATLKDVSERTTSDARGFLPELYVLCAEQALRLGCEEITEDCLMMYLESNPPPNQFLCRAYFCQAQLNSPRTATSVDRMEKAVMCCLKAIEVSKVKPRYHFLVFNASVLYFQTVKGFLRPGLHQHLLSSLTQVLGALEEVHEPDYAWRAELMIHRVECLLDAGKKNEAEEYSKVTSEFIKLHTPELYPHIFSIQVQHDLIDVSDILTELSPQLRTIFKIQKLKHTKVSKCGNAPEELGEIFLLLTQSSQSPQSQSPACHSSRSENSPSITLTERIELLLELAFLSLEVKEPRCAKDCLKELQTIDDLSVGQRIMAECVECGISLLKQSGCIEDYTKSSVEAQLTVVGRLETLVCRAVMEGDAQVTQCVCAALWNSCLPLLQHNLRKSVKKPLLTLAQALEGINSMLLEVRCQVHTELAAIEEEAERLEVAIKHLHTALDLDETGQYRQLLSSSLHRLQLLSKPYCTPTRPEDQAAMLIQQVQQGKNRCSSEPAKKWHSMLVSAGMALAPDTFQMVLDADSSSKVLGRKFQDYVEQLANKALHHKTCVQKAEGHLARMEGDTDDQERMRLWASLVKAARKLELWNVCRAACRFCLLYDDRRWKIDSDQMYKEEKGKRELLRLLAEVHFINAEAIIHKLLSEGVELNVLPVPPIKKGVCVPENDPHWTLYRDWIQELSAYATTNFLKGAELGAELQEPWLVVNAAVYLWNYNSHLLSSGGQLMLLPTFSRMVELLRETGHAGEVVLLVLLCNTVAQGIIQPWCGVPVCTAQKEVKLQAQADKTKKSGGKGMEKSGSTHGLEANALQDLKKALQLCEYALQLSNGNDEKVPIMVRKQLISTWVKTKQLLQQQIGQKLNTDYECKNEAVAAMSQVLVGVEMLLCNNNPGLMEFTVPSHAMLVRMASACKWTDPVVELYAWYQLAHFAHQRSDHDLVMICTQNALQLEQTAIQKTKSAVYKLYSVKAVQEMLSSAARMRGLSMLHNSCGHLAKYMEALGILQSSISFAEQADSWPLCGNAVRCYWNACLPLLEIPEQRQQLQNPLEQILKALTHTSPQPATERSKVMTSQKELQTTPATSVTDTDTVDLAVRAAMYNVLFHIHADSGNLKCGLQVLDHAIREMPWSPHRLVLCKQRVLARAQLGESVELDMQKFAENGELDCATMWHRVAHSAREKLQQMHGYQNAIAVLQSADSRWHKLDLLIEFGAWLYSNNFPISDAQLQIQSAMDILLSSQSEICQSSSYPNTVEQADTAVSDNSLSQLEEQARLSLPVLPEIQRLCALVQAHTLLALMGSKVSAQHQQHLIQAYQFVLKIWQVSMENTQEAINEALKNPVTLAPPVSAPSPKKYVEKEKAQNKKSKEPLVEKKPGVPVSETSPPSSTEEWARFECSEELRQAFRKDLSSHSISNFNISMQSRTLFYLDVLVKELDSVSLTPLTLPPLYLAEVIAHDLLNIKSHSDLYRLRIVKTCCELGLETSSPYRETLLSLAHIPEEEQMLCRRAITLQKERNGPEVKSKKTHAMTSGLSRMVTSEVGVCRTRLDRHTLQELWMEKAAVCLRMGLHQPARCLLAEAHLVSKELGDQTLLAKCFLLLATLASLEQQHGQACALLEHAQEIGGDEDFWYNLAQSLLKITAKRDGDPYTQLCQITDTATGVFKSVIDQKVNRAPVIHFYIGSLQATGAVLCRMAVKPACPGQAVNAETVRRLNSVCDTLKHAAATLLQYGYKTPAAETAVEQANTLRMLAMLTSIEEEKQKRLLDALSLMQQAVSLQEEVLSSCLRLLPPHECEWNRLPAMRVCVRLRLALADLGLLMLEIQCEKEMAQAKIRSMKSPTEQAMDDYIRSSTDLSDLENEWLTVVQTVGQVTLTQLTVVHSLSKHSVEIRTRCLCMLGKCLRLMAHRRDPLCPAAMWDRIMQVADCAEWKENRAEDKNEESSKEGKECTLQEGSKSADLQSGQTTVEQLLKQAIETLTEALTLGLQHSLPELLCHVCVELVECHGHYDPAISGQYLALLQSCMCCTEMSRVLHAACSNSDQSQVAALLSLQKSLKVTQQNRESCMLSAIDHELRTISKAYRQLAISPNHLNFLGEIPSNIKILLLQHTGDGSVLYGAFYEKAQAIDGPKKKSIQIPGGLVCSRVAKAQVQPSDLLRLQDQVQAFRHLTAQTLLKESRRHRSAVQTEHYRQLEHIIDQELGTQFQAIVKEMEDYLHPILSQFDFSCFSLCHSVIAIDEETLPKDKEEIGATDKTLLGSLEEQEQCVVLLADRMLLELPIEAVSVLQQNLISSVSRDLSLQVFHSRLQRYEPVEGDNNKETKDGKSAKGKGDQGKGIKMVPVNRVLPAHALPVDTHKVKYIIDSHTEKKDSQWSIPAESLRKTLEMSSEFTAHWEGIMGSERSYNPEDLECLLANCSSFIFCSPDRLLSHISPARLTTLNLNECQMAILFDLIPSETSMWRQSQRDMWTSKVHLDLEAPLECVYLLTLCGVHAVMLKQWSSSPMTNANNLDAILENLLKKGLTSGQAVYSLRRTGMEEGNGNTSVQREAENAADESAVPCSAFNFIIYGLPNLVII